jgi:hypothetical protein
MPYIPYCWQQKGEQILLKSGQSKRINVLGIINSKNDLFAELFEESIDSRLLIKSLDKFSKGLKKKTVIVMDQSPIHTSDAVINRLEKWQEKN